MFINFSRHVIGSYSNEVAGTRAKDFRERSYGSELKIVARAEDDSADGEPVVASKTLGKKLGQLFRAS